MGRVLAELFWWVRKEFRGEMKWQRGGAWDFVEAVSVARVLKRGMVLGGRGGGGRGVDKFWGRWIWREPVFEKGIADGTNKGWASRVSYWYPLATVLYSTVRVGHGIDVRHVSRMTDEARARWRSDAVWPKLFLTGPPDVTAPFAPRSPSPYRYTNIPLIPRAMHTGSLPHTLTPYDNLPHF